MLILYGLTIFVSATLLFLVQPMFARMALPLLGGVPAVWNTAQVFYQAALLVGYGYAHLSTRWLGLRRQAALHLALLTLPLLVLPIAIPAGWTPPRESNPSLWLLALLAVAVGLPFFVVSTSSPLLQRWFSGTGHPAAADPYFLYAASNVGSMLALLSYPLAVEPNLALPDQSRLWALGYGLLLVLTGGCAIAVWRAPDVVIAQPGGGRARDTVAAAPAPISARRRLRWVLLSFVPSSLMLSVTTYLSTDIAAIPLLWVVPLALYLLTFILVFATRPPLPHWLMVRALPFVLLPLVIVLAARATQPITLLIALHLATFFVVAMVCHGQIARDRPPTEHLTEFYLWMSVGGMLGGLFNALIAPQLFTGIVEYPLMLVLACLLVPPGAASAGPAPEPAVASPRRRPQLLDLGLPIGLSALCALLVAVAEAGGVPSGPASTGLMFGLPALLCFSFSRRPLRFGLGIAAILLVSAATSGVSGQVLYAERSFFGVHRVTLDPSGQYHLLLHGSTLHGKQSLDPARRREPLTYYYPSGPLGQLFGTLTPQPRSIAVVGLGSGAIACYAQPGQRWTFYEIDPTVERIARDPRYFNFLSDCTPDAQVVLGDARLSLDEAAGQQFDLLVLDAYSSDSIPMHLLTREALQLYAARLAPRGLLVFHISNRHLDLEPVLGNLAADAGLVSLTEDDATLTAEEEALGKQASQWVVLARQPADLAALAADRRWRSLRRDAGALWTDQFSSIVGVFR